MSIIMCGIVGYIGSSCVPITPKDRRLLSKSIKVRGPDHQDNVKMKIKSYEAYLCHSRLSILDVSDQSNQPFTESKFKNILIYNGEIYNFKELIIEFSIPPNFAHSDTTVLYFLLSKFPIQKVLDLVTGMFAFVFYKKKKEKFYIVRDRLGEKPLYFLCPKINMNNLFLFSSDISSFFNLENIPISFCKESINQFIDFGFVLGNKTIIKDVYELEPGSYIKIQLGKKLIIKKSNYFNLNLQNFKLQPDESNIRNKIKTAIHNCLVSDVPIGTFLSGGLDSTMVTALASQKKKITAYTVAFKEDNELLVAQENAKRFGVTHKIILLKKEQLLKKIENYLNFVTEPIGDDSGFLVNLVAGCARKNSNKVLIGGDCGDEIFFGYERMISAFKIINKFKIINFIKFKKIYKKNSKLGKLWDLNTSSIEEFYVNYYLSNSPKNWYKYDTIFTGSVFHKIRNLELTLYLGKNNFKKLDYNTMLNGVEGRTPLASTNIINAFNDNFQLDINYRKTIFKDLLNKTGIEIDTVKNKSGFGIKNNLEILKYLQLKNNQDKVLKKFLDITSLSKSFNIDSFVVNFRLRSLSIFLKKNLKEIYVT